MEETTMQWRKYEHGQMPAVGQECLFTIALLGSGKRKVVSARYTEFQQQRLEIQGVHPSTQQDHYQVVAWMPAPAAYKG